jgi:hypothetical protein
VDGLKEAAEKVLFSRQHPEKRPSGAKAHADSVALTARFAAANRALKRNGISIVLQVEQSKQKQRVWANAAS